MPPEDDDVEVRARAVARRRTALVLLAAVCVLLIAEIWLPDTQFHIDPVVFGLVMTAILLLNDISVPWRGP